MPHLLADRQFGRPNLSGLAVCPLFDRTTRVCKRVVDLGLATSRSYHRERKAAILGEALNVEL